MSLPYVFSPAYTEGVSVSPAAASARSAVKKGTTSLCLTNTGANICYVRSGGSAVVATATDYLVPPGVQVVIRRQIDDTHVAYISAAGTTLHILPGDGF